MKFKVTSENKFEPITLEITLENVAELKSMWARTVLGNNFDYNGHPKVREAEMDTFSIWKYLDNELIKYT